MGPGTKSRKRQAERPLITASSPGPAVGFMCLGTAHISQRQLCKSLPPFFLLRSVESTTERTKSNLLLFSSAHRDNGVSGSGHRASQASTSPVGIANRARVMVAAAPGREFSLGRGIRGSGMGRVQQRTIYCFRNEGEGKRTRQLLRIWTVFRTLGCLYLST